MFHARGRIRALALLVLAPFRHPATAIGCLAALAGCASHHPVPIDDDGLPVTTAADDNPPPSSDHGPGGGRGLWSDVLHTAMQAGMGMLHH
ncbi:hypothetical protein ACOZ4Y_02245 [Komagataeibacter rhaeticus]|uniref:hypothetical protein n=1 Tax=Komagataeibacter rhaeticus TaxID=215221 RepID=UPI000AA167B9|nr:hypothetical protein [Komagataeibacter rhaeticus]GBQ14815.1 hypothetical protein AA16663_1894 [Komagataeibacter rhaeticus DSM 16663]